jgi:hypothetical protein
LVTQVVPSTNATTELLTPLVVEAKSFTQARRTGVKATNATFRASLLAEEGVKD